MIERNLHASRKHVAFTLAEVLITLGIIGVVAVMTISTLIEKHREKVTVTKLAQTYSILQNATERMVQDEYSGLENAWGDYPSRTFSELLPKYIQVSEVTRDKNKLCCFNRAGTILGVNYSTNKMYAFLNGVELIINPNGEIDTVYNKCTTDTRYNESFYFGSCGDFLVDIDGFNNGKNVYGYDVFKFALVRNGVLPYGMPRASIWTENFSQCLNENSWYPYGCTAWVVYNKNMDYLKCPDKLGWDKQSSCK